MYYRGFQPWSLLIQSRYFEEEQLDRQAAFDAMSSIDSLKPWVLEPTPRPDEHTQSSSSSSSTQAPKPRRELVWGAQEHSKTSLKSIYQQFGNFLGLRSANNHTIPLQRRRGRKVHGLYHKCSGYIREEITLTTSILDSAIVMHACPTPKEICSICGVVVSEGEVFRCECGSGT